MAEVIKCWETTDSRLGLDIESDLRDLELAAVEPLWALLQASSLTGVFKIVIRKKIPGVHQPGKLVKIVGLGQTFTYVTVKMQSAPDACYEGRLSGQTKERHLIGASKINQDLLAVAGNHWYDPSVPMSKKPEPVVLSPIPLVSVESAVVAAVAPQPGPDALLKAIKEKSPALGISGNLELAKTIFQKMMEKVVAGGAGHIGSVEISAIVVEVVYGADSDKDLKCGAPVMTAWAKKGWLKREGRKGNVAIYTITEKAVALFGLTPPPVPVSVPVPSAQPLELTPADSNILQIMKVVTEKAERYQAAQAEAIKLDEELKGLLEKRDALKVILADPDLVKANEVLSGLQGFAPKPPVI